MYIYIYIYVYLPDTVFVTVCYICNVLLYIVTIYHLFWYVVCMLLHVASLPPTMVSARSPLLSPEGTKRHVGQRIWHDIRWNRQPYRDMAQRRHQTCHFHKRATSVPAKGPSYWLYFARHVIVTCVHTCGGKLANACNSIEDHRISSPTLRTRGSEGGTIRFETLLEL